MKKLIYFYCEDLRGFEDTEFNFSSKYKIHFDKDTEILTIDKGDENYIDNFYGENIELNAIVGNNGAGKSTLLKRVYELSIKFRFSYNPIYLFENITEIIICYHRRYKIVDISKNINFPIEMNLNNFDSNRFTYSSGGIGVRRVYITQVLDQELYFKGDDNYSTGGITAKFKEKNNNGEIAPFFYDRFANQIIFLSDKIVFKDKNHKNINLPFKTHEFVGISVLSFATLYYSLKYISKNEKVDENLLIKMIDNFKGIKYRKSTYNLFLEGLISSFIIGIYNQEKIFHSCGKSLFELLYKCMISNKFKNMNNIDEQVNYLLKQINKEISISTETYQEFLTLFREAKWISGKNGDNNYFKIPLVYIKEFYEKYSKIEPNEPFLEFSWGLSSGENAMLDLYSKFYQIYKSTIKDNEVNFYGKPKYENIILLIDEADAYFHPQWQKDYVKDTLNVAKQIFEGFGVQIILATHSPIMLSDIPKQNVLYLKKEENDGTKVVPREERQETFGANIFSLFKDTFFLEGSGIGSFAEENLEKLLKRIHNLKEINEEEIEYIKKRIMMIGDPFIRQKFENEFCICIEKKDSQRSLDEKIRFFEKEIESLKKQKERDKNDKD